MKQAIQRLFETEDYIAQGSLDGAIHFVDKLILRSEELARYSQLGRVVPELGDKNIREIIEGSYRLVYRISKNIEVLTVFEGHRLFQLKDVEES